MKDVGWSALQMFAQVARAGSLAGAAEATGVSAPTIGRQMHALEAELGRALFARRRTGYALLPDGRVLYERVRGMEASAGAIEDWRRGAHALPIVTLAVGPWMSAFLGRRLDALWTPRDRFRLCFKIAEAPLDIERREAVVALAAARPASGNVAAQRLGPVAFAPFRARGFDAERDCAWIALGTERATTAAERWTFEQPGHWIAAWTTDRGALHHLAVGGAGRAVLPCYLGDDDPDLVRAGPVLSELEEEHWLLAHDDDRHRPEVREVIDRLKAFMACSASLFAGERGGPTG